MVTVKAAAVAVQLVQERARADATLALAEAQRRTELWGSGRAERLVSRTPGSGQDGLRTFRVPLASRPLRDWYLHVYTDTVREIFGQPTTGPVTSADIERTAAEVSRLAPAASPQGALRITATLAALGSEHAVVQAARTYLELGRDAAARAPVRGQVPGIDGVPSDILQAWYQRCFRDAADFTVRDQPLRAVSKAEATLVAQAVAARQTRRIVGADGIVVVTPHATLVNDVDRRIAAGEVGVVDPRTVLRADATLALQVRKGWRDTSTDSRRAVIEGAGAGDVDPRTSWSKLPWPVATAYIRQWIDTHRSADPAADHPVGEQLTTAQLFKECERLTGPRAAAAAQMFNLPVGAPPSGYDIPEGVRSVLAEIVNRRQTPAATTANPAAQLAASLAKTGAILRGNPRPAPGAPEPSRRPHQPERSPQPHPDPGGLDRD